tara:strand:- start:1530 stop:1709 length:180 start_codon:yes stop_codon:yes gene_type:complete
MNAVNEAKQNIMIEQMKQFARNENAAARKKWGFCMGQDEARTAKENGKLGGRGKWKEEK